MSEYATATETDLQEALFAPNPRAHVILAEAAGEPVGIALFYYTFSTFRARTNIFLEDLFVEPAHRGTGLGLALMRELANRAVAENCGRIEWRVLDWNQPAIDFYERLGAKPISLWHTRHWAATRSSPWRKEFLMAEQAFDLVVLGGGPGGYVAAIRAAQLGMKTAVVEREHLGGICLNWGCIPTKALLRTSEINHLLHHLPDFGFDAVTPKFNIEKVVKRSRGVAKQLASGVGHLLRKNKVTVFDGTGKLAENRPFQ